MPALVVAALAAAVTGAMFLLRPRRVVVAGRSMEPTLEAGDRLLVARAGQLKAGDVVALRDPRSKERVIVKRVSAVRRGEVVVRGDNPPASVDSRFFGPVPNRDVLGRVVRRYAPAARAGPVR
ncbi:MAG TPA: nickel-type superoxide dismutase maturation protease [Acidimicrobiales bacterium]|nr:nickel-type superoxide dismutase maturation protease [Acidimicrobiales bacterium]